MADFIVGGRMERMSAAEWIRATELLASTRAVSVASDSVKADLEPHKLLALLMTCEDDGLCSLHYQIYHDCEDHPVATRKHEEGLPEFPFPCPECEQDIKSPSEIRVDVESWAPESIRIRR